MPARHLVEVGNVDADGSSSTRPGPAMVWCRLARCWRWPPVDPFAHLNRDFLDHCLSDFAVVECSIQERPGQSRNADRGQCLHSQEANRGVLGSPLRRPLRD